MVVYGHYIILVKADISETSLYMPNANHNTHPYDIRVVAISCVGLNSSSI